MINIKRIYDLPAETDGYRILIDRLWPRGLSKKRAAISEWFKDIAPSSELRVWFGHKPERFTEFSKRYVQELDQNSATAEFLRLCMTHKNVTLLYGAKDPNINQATVLLDYCESKVQDLYIRPE